MQASTKSDSETPDNNSAPSMDQRHAIRREENQRSELDMDANTQADVPKDEIIATAVRTRDDGTMQIYLKVRAPDGAIKVVKSQDFKDREDLCLYWEKHLKIEGEKFNIESEAG